MVYSNKSKSVFHKKNNQDKWNIAVFIYDTDTLAVNSVMVMTST